MDQRCITLIVLSCIPAVLCAHGSHGNGVMAGFTHPILGVDHNVALLACGLLAYLLDQNKWFLFTLAFVISMLIGGFLGVSREATFLVEKVIAFSSLVMGIMIAYRKSLNIWIIVALFFVFGAFHGYAHGAEMDPSNSVFKYIPGYILGAILLTLAGAMIAKMVYGRTNSENSIRLLAGIIIGCGIMFLLP